MVLFNDIQELSDWLSRECFIPGWLAGRSFYLEENLDVAMFDTREAQSGGSQMSLYFERRKEALKIVVPTLRVVATVKKEAATTAVKAWALDLPRDGDVEYDAFDIVVRGWLLAAVPGGGEEIIVRGDGFGEIRTRFEVARPDVVKGFLKQDPDGHKFVQCGFHVQVPPIGPGFRISFASGAIEIGLAVVEIRGVP